MLKYRRVFERIQANAMATFAGENRHWGKGRNTVAKALILLSCCLIFLDSVTANHDAKLLYDDLLSSYNK